jgi:hypothetical protein
VTVGQRSVDDADELEDKELELDNELEQTVVDRLAAYDRGDIEASDWKDVKARIEASLDQK